MAPAWHTESVQALAFWKTVTDDKTDLLESIVETLSTGDVSYCVIGGQAVNAFVEPVVSLDLDLAVVAEDIARASELFKDAGLTIKRFEHSINVSRAGSDLRVQLQTDPRYARFPPRSSIRDVLGLPLPVAHVEDVLQGKIWAASDPNRRPSKWLKDLADIARLVESFPELLDRVPGEIRERMT